MRHFIVAAIIVILLMVGTYFLLDNIQLLPEQASLQARSIDELFRFDFIAIAVLFSLIIGLMIYSIIFFRRKKGDETDGPHIEGNTPLEVVWTLVPLGFVLFLAYYGSSILGKVEAPDPRPLRVEVIGSQWSWRFEYPDYDIISTELVLPVNKQALLNMTSTDVIHSFWIPEFRVKQDLLPGEGFEKELRITPIELGEYKVRCAELCGREHYAMLAPVAVLTEANFEAWVAEESGTVSDDPVVRGELVAKQFGCTACHSSDGSALAGPSWLGVYGSTEMLADGTSIMVDEAYLVESIREPGSKIVEGFLNIMPENIGADLTDEKIDDLLAFIASLQ